MSGGYFDYKQYQIDDMAGMIEQLVRNNKDEALNPWGDKIGRNYSDATICQFIAAVATLRRAAAYAQRIDWLLSGDDGEESFLARLKEDLHTDQPTTSNT